MMTIIPIRSICLLLLTSSVLHAEEIDLTFEVMQAPKQELHTIEQKAKVLQKKGFICHIDTKKDTLFLHCNDTHSIDEMQKSMNSFKENQIDYTIIYKELTEKTNYRDPNIFYLGYKAYDRGEYEKALSIFAYNYNKSPDFEHSYAYALTLMKLKQYSKALKVLEKFNDHTKAQKLSKDIAETYMYEQLSQKNYQNAHTIVKTYLNDEKEYHTVIAQKEYGERFEAKQYNEAKALAETYGLSEKSADAEYMIALQYVEQKEYTKALDILTRLKKSSPDAQKLYNDILYVKTLDQGWQELKYDSKSALISFQQACKLKDTLSCKKGLMYAYYKSNNYNHAYTLSEELYSREKSDEFASIAMYSAKALKKTEETKAWYAKIKNKEGIVDPNVIRYVQSKQSSKIASYVRQGDAYRKTKDHQALDAYQKAIALDRSDVNLKILYLYALKDLQKYTLLETELQRAYSMYPKQTKALKRFKYVYQKSRLYDYYENKQYKECLVYAKEIEKDIHDESVYRMGGWCAYALKKYDEASEQFAKIKPNTKDSYAYALSSYQNEAFDEAIDTLSTIDPVDDSQRINIASLYSDLSMQEKAKELLTTLPESSEKETLKNRINKKYFYDRYDHSLSLGVDYRTRNAYDGKNRFNIYSTPLDYDYLDPVKKYHLYFDGDLLHLSNTHIDPTTDFGFNTNPWTDNKSRKTGFSPTVGLDYNNIKVELGLTPMGYEIDPKPLWLLSYTHLYENFRFNAVFTQKNIDDTMLSYVGEKTIHPNSGEKVHWGRVIKQGYTASISHDMDDIILALNLEYYPKIYGQNVIENSEFKTTAMMLYFPDVEYFSFMQIGLLANYDSYDKNSDLYTYGHGGYFSPQEFWLGSLFTQFGDYINDNFYYQSKLSVGYEWYQVDDVNQFPLNPEHSIIQRGYTNSGIAYKAAFQLGYKITDHLDLVSGISIENMQEYEEKRASFAFTYRFRSTKYRHFDTFKMNHNIDENMK